MKSNQKNSKDLKDIIKEEYKKCAEDSLYFIKKYVKITHQKRGTIPFNLFPFQENALKSFHDNKFNIILKARQMGISTLVAAHSLWTMLFHENKNILVISLTQDTAKEVVTKAKFAYDNLPSWLKLPVIEDNKLSLKLNNGSLIKAASTTSKSGVSLSNSILIIDEAALIENASDLWSSAQPTLSTGGSCTILSCVTGDTYVFTDAGLKQVNDFIESDVVGDNIIKKYNILGHSTLRSSNLFKNNGVTDTIKIVTKFGELEGSKIHKLWSYKADTDTFGWHKLEELTKHDYVSIQYGMNIWSNNDKINFKPSVSNKIHSPFMSNDITKELAYLFGLYIAEGSCYKVLNKSGNLVGGNITITCGDKDITWIFDKLNLKYYTNDWMHYTISNKNLIELFEHVGFDLKKTASEKIIPARLLQCSSEIIKYILIGIFDCNGTSSKGNVSLSSTSEKLLNQVRMLLNNFGILSTKNYTSKEKLNARKSCKNKHNSGVYVLDIYGKFALKYFNLIGFCIKRKQDNKQLLLKQNLNRNCSHDVIPNSLQLVKTLYKNSNETTYSLNFKYGLNIGCILSNKKTYKTNNISRGIVNIMYNNFKNGLLPDEIDYYDKIIDENVYWCKIKTVEYSKNNTYDFSLPNNENDFWCHSVIYNGFIGHQTPRGVGQWFHKMWVEAEEGKNGFIPIKMHWSLHPERNQEWRDKEGAKMASPKEAAREYDCDFMTSGNTVVDLAIIQWYKETIKRDPVECRGIDKSLWVWEYPDYSRNYIVCLPTGETVVTDAGIKNIEHVSYNDKLINKDGHLTDIIDIKIRQYNGKIYEITPSNTFRTTKFTDEHPILVSKSSKLKRMLRKNDVTYSFNQRYWEHDFEFISAKHVKPGDWICYPNIYKKRSFIKTYQIWNEFENVGRTDFQLKTNPLLNDDFWWFVGIWLAEGWCYTDKNGNITIHTSHNSNEIDIINRIKNVVNNLGRELLIIPTKNNTTNCQFNSKQIGGFLIKYFGKYAGGKFISENIKYLSETHKKLLFTGYMEGDGCIINTKTGGKCIEITSISLRLLEDFQDILFSIGCISTINLLRNAKKSVIRGKIVNQKEAYLLSIHDFGCSKILNNHIPKSKTQRIADCYFDINEDYIYFKVKKVKELDYSGLVHNFTTSTGTFLCKHITTHNCADIARGDGMDYSAFHVLDAETLNQCAEYKGQIDTTSFGHMLVNVATEYNKALLIIENTGVGWAVIQVVVDLSYPNTFYSSVDLKYVEVQRQLITNFYSEEKKMVPGFSTTLKTRPLIISRLEQYLRDKAVNLYSIRTLGELETFIWDKGKAQAMIGYNDDLIMSLGIGLWVRDTALRLKSESMEYSRTMINKISRAEYTGSTPVYTHRSNNTAYESWNMHTGKGEVRENLTWLL